MGVTARKHSRLEIITLGAPRIELGGRPVSFDTRKATALLIYLAVTDRPHRRETIAALLWPERDEEHARGALRRTLSVIRTGLGPDRLHADSDTLGLHQNQLRVDVTELRRALAEGRFTDAVRSYRGEFLAGFALRDAPAFDEWHAAESERLRSDLSGALAKLVARHEAAGAPERALPYARRWLELDALHEPAHRALMRLHALAGDRAAALRQYRECAALLDRELGVAPHPETHALERAIREGTSAPSAILQARPADEALGDVHTLHGDYVRAIASYEAALAGADDDARGVLEHKLADVHHRRGDWARAAEHYRAARDAARDDAARARVSADWSLASHRSGDAAGAARLARESLELAESANDARALAQAHNILGVLTRDARHLRRSVEIATTLPDPSLRVAALNNLALALGRDGHADRAIPLAEEALALCVRLGDRHREAALHNNLADLLKAAGRQSESMRHLKRAVTLFAEIGAPQELEPEVWKLVEW